MLVPALLALVVSCACLGRVTGAVNPEGSQVHGISSAMSSLEKKMEFLIQQVQDIKTQLESTKTQLESRIEENQVLMDTKIASMEIKQQNVVEELSSIQMKMNTSVAAAVDEKFDDFSSRYDVPDMVRNAPTAFAARVTSDFIYAAGETIIFPEVTLNSGDAYNSGTGIFTCPLEGIYFFTASTLSWTAATPTNNPAAQIMRGDEALVGLEFHPGDAEHIMMSNSVMMSCAAQQQVSVRAWGVLEVDNSLYTSTFSGFYLGS